MRNLINRQMPILLSLLVALLLTACNQAEAAPPDAAASGEITVYTAMNETLAKNYLVTFRQQYPRIKVNLLRESTGVLTQRIFDEAANPQADVLWEVAASSLLLAEWNDLLEPYEPAGLERIRPLFHDTKSPPNWVGNDVLMLVFCVNRAKLEESVLPAPESWQDLLDPVYKGHLVMANPNTSGTGYIVVADLLYLFGEQNGWDYLDGLDQNIAEYTRSGSAPCRLAAAGDYAIGISSASEGLALEKEEPDLDTVYPSEGSGWGVRANALVRKTETKAAAKTFLDWAISDEAMALYAQDRILISADIDQPTIEGAPADPVAQLLPKDIPWAAANRTQILKEWLDRYGDQIESSN